MRIGPIGALYRKSDPDILGKVAFESSLVTHANIIAAAVSYAIAYCVYCFVNGRDDTYVREHLPKAVMIQENAFHKNMISKKKSKSVEIVQESELWKVNFEYQNATSTNLQILFDYVDTFVKEGKVVDIDSIRELISQSSRPYLAPGFTKAQPNQGFGLLGGLHAIVLSTLPDIEPHNILCSIIKMGYDTDTVGAIAGSILGARFGTQWIPIQRFIDQIRLEAYADRLVLQIAPQENGTELFLRERALSMADGSYKQQLVSRYTNNDAKNKSKRNYKRGGRKQKNY